MSITLINSKDREEWLNQRWGTIGGSDAAAVLGISPWKTNVELWEELSGNIEPKSVTSDRIVFGQKAEEHIRELFALSHPGYKVEYIPNNLYLNSECYWAHASLDGSLTDSAGRKGILEIKTGTRSSEWGLETIPNHYFAQILHYLMVMDADFAVVVAFLKNYSNYPEYWMQSYILRREEVTEDIELLKSEEKRFYDSINYKEKPALKLPEI